MLIIAAIYFKKLLHFKKKKSFKKANNKRMYVLTNEST